MTTQRIAANDPGQAHALARKHHARDSERSSRIGARLAGVTSVKDFCRALMALGEHVIDVQIGRPHGSRAWASAVLLEPLSHGAGYTIAQVVFDARSTPHVVGRTSKFRVSTHAIARMFHRSLGADDLGEVAQRLVSHFVAFARFIAEHPDALLADGEIVSAGKGGALLGNVEGGLVMFRTWVDAGNAADPELRRLAAMPDTVTVRFTQDSWD